MNVWQAMRQSVKHLANGQTYATVKRGSATEPLARQYGTYLSGGRYWFAAGAYTAYLAAVEVHSC
jgi:hypothetical protein